MPSQSRAHSSVGLQDCSMGTSQIDVSSHYSKRLFKSREAEISVGLCNSNAQQKSDCTSKNVQDCGVLQQVFLVTKPGKKWRPVIDLSVLNNHLSVPTFKMEIAQVI